MVQWSVDALRAVASVDRIVVALPEGEGAPEGTTGVRGRFGALGVGTRGPRRRRPGDPVIVHDAARPLVTPDDVEATLAALGDADGAISAAPVADTIKEVDADGTVQATLDRSRLWAVQTPQTFRRAALERALDVDDDTLAAATDDAWLVERAGGTVRVVSVSPDNLKVTTAVDLQRAELALRDRC